MTTIAQETQTHSTISADPGLFALITLLRCHGIAAEPGDATRPYVVKVKPAGEADQVISYLPAGTGTVSRQAVIPAAAPGCPPVPP